MARTVAIGRQDFGKIIENNCFYIDKTLFIKEWWENGDDVTLITRPRRFGKTLTMSMAEQFFSIQYAGRSDLFEGLKIWEEEKYRKLQGTYPVIFISFAAVKGRTYQNTQARICQLITDIYSAHTFLLDSNQLSAEDKQYFKSVSDHMSYDAAVMAVNRLSGFLAKHYGKKVIILLDEYDAPMQEAYVNGYWEDVVCFMRELFNAAFKTNPWLERALMTGITRVSKESVFSDLNNLEVVTATSDKYETAFGFTEAEVFQSMEEYGLSGQKQEVRKWYDGFTFGRHSNIYNPWSISNFLDKRKFMPYWANTSSNRLVSQLVQQGSCEMKLDMENLLLGRTLRIAIDEEIVYNQLDDQEDMVWSLLLAGGYLKIEQVQMNRKMEQEYVLALTNYEVCRMFSRMFMEWFTKKEFKYNKFSNALLCDDVEYMNQYMNGITNAVFSYFDTGEKPSEIKQPENFYHGFVLGIVADLREIYSITSNRESGLGRYDVMLEPKEAGDAAILIEFKVFNPETEHSLEDTVKSALKQIEEKRYAAAFIDKGIPENKIRKYGFAFKGKTVLIRNGKDI